MRSATARAAALCAFVLAFACTTARLATPAGEAKLGADEAALVDEEIGLIESPALERYLDEIGARLVRDPSVRHEITYRFRIVDMVEPNAFALPGGYIYVSRGMLPLLNREDELASVLAHEIGHVTARHHLRQQLIATPLIPIRLATGIGSLATGIVSPGLGQLVGALGDAPGSLVLAGHSRGQEDDADRIGQTLVAHAGWDPRAIAAVMDALSRDQKQEGGDPDRLSYFDTHPTTPSRSQRTLERAATLEQTRLAPIAADARHFFEQMDGLLCGDPAENGVIVEREFLHAPLDVRIAFPEKWQIENGPESVVAAPESRDAVALFSIAADGDDPVAVAKQVVRDAGLTLVKNVEATQVGGLPAARAEARSRAGWFSVHRHLVTWIAQGGHVYQLVATAEESAFEKRRAELTEFVESFRPLSAGDRAKIRDAHLRIVDVRPGESLAKLVARIDSAWSIERTAAANDIGGGGDALAVGRPVKVARWEVYEGDAKD